ncbi:hypothetical protein E2C01_053621 [Portunus trituberculatus]|uniref:Uncharacterized protein n=1 Tax=Portunus trituberculatus TaxID=210409 RepID=A0A5B7GQZ1_PORTR|nr:hypothetical protein [Portunus trituberculatus]
MAPVDTLEEYILYHHSNAPEWATFLRGRLVVARPPLWTTPTLSGPAKLRPVAQLLAAPLTGTQPWPVLLCHRGRRIARRYRPQPPVLLLITGRAAPRHPTSRHATPPSAAARHKKKKIKKIQETKKLPQRGNACSVKSLYNKGLRGHDDSILLQDLVPTRLG